MAGPRHVPDWLRKRCRRCGEGMVTHDPESDVCEECWNNLGQMSFEIEEEDVDADQHDVRRGW